MQRRGNGTVVVSSMMANKGNVTTEINEMPGGQWIFGDSKPYRYVKTAEEMLGRGFAPEQVVTVQPWLTKQHETPTPDETKETVAVTEGRDLASIMKNMAPEESAEIMDIVQRTITAYLAERQASSSQAGQANSAGDGYGQETPAPPIDETGGYFDARPHPETGGKWWRPAGVSDDNTEAVTPEMLEAQLHSQETGLAGIDAVGGSDSDRPLERQKSGRSKKTTA